MWNKGSIFFCIILLSCAHRVEVQRPLCLLQKKNSAGLYLAPFSFYRRLYFWGRGDLKANQLEHSPRFEHHITDETNPTATDYRTFTVSIEHLLAENKINCEKVSELKLTLEKNPWDAILSIVPALQVWSVKLEGKVDIR